MPKEQIKPANELGFGTITSSNSQRLLTKEGISTVKYIGAPTITVSEIFHYLTTMSWLRFLIFVFLLYLIANAFFGFLYTFTCIEGLGVTHTTFLKDFKEAFFFSTQAFTTVGFGRVSPITTVANVIASIESLMGLLTFALVTGLIYGRFSRPVSHIIRSENLLISPYKDITGAMFRIATKRTKSMLLKNNMILSVGLNDISGNEVRRRFYSLDLELSTISFLTLSWTIVHPITAESPLYGLTAKDYIERKVEFIALFSAVEETTNQTVLDKFSYAYEDIKVNAKFETMVIIDDTGNRYVNLKKINKHTFN